MKITGVTVWKENLELTRPYTIAYETVSTVENLFVLLEADGGIVGIGAGSPAEDVTGETIGACENALTEHLETLVKGRDIRYFRSMLRDLGQVLGKTPAAMAAADIALHDLVARAAGLPLADLLGRSHQGLETSITIGIKPLMETLDEAREYVSRGFSILKVKTGLDVDQDIERVRRLSEIYGSGIRMRVDANQGYDADALRLFHEKTAGLVEFIEQPLKTSDLAGMRSMPPAVCRISAADECLLSPATALDLFCPPRPFGIFNIKLMKCGGISPGLEIASMAAHAGIDLMWGCMDESIVSIAGALHAALASGATRYLDLDGSLDLARDIVSGGFILENGYLRTTDEPGLGVKRI
jgi:L-alanine-DL-glutamate epimerase-like enolase superfamily enzyme